MGYLGQAVGAVRDALDPVARQEQVVQACDLHWARGIAAGAEVRHGTRRPDHRAVHYLCSAGNPQPRGCSQPAPTVQKTVEPTKLYKVGAGDRLLSKSSMHSFVDTDMLADMLTNQRRLQISTQKPT